MSLVNDVVSKLFGNTVSKDIYSKEFMMQSFKNSENIMVNYYEQTPDLAIKEFLFENGDFAKLLKKYIENKDEFKEKNT